MMEETTKVTETMSDTSPLTGVKLYEKGNELRDLGEYEEAFQHYRQALDCLADLVMRMLVFYDWALAHDFCGSVERSTHYFQRSLHTFQEFAAQNPDDERIPALSGLMYGVVEILRVRSLVGQDATHYLDGVRCLRWPSQYWPLKVFIQNDSAGFDAALCDLIWSAFLPWMEASPQVKLKRVSSWGSSVDIHVIRALPGMIPPSAGGQTTFEETPDLEINRVKMRLFVASRYEAQLTEKQKDSLFSLVLHEAGHALGLDGHSPFGDDILYFKSPRMVLSERDKATISRLYPFG